MNSKNTNLIIIDALNYKIVEEMLFLRLTKLTRSLLSTGFIYSDCVRTFSKEIVKPFKL